MNRRILVTGAGGYIGSVSLYSLLKKGYEVIAIDNFSTGYKQPLEILQKEFGSKSLRIYQINLMDNLDKIFCKEDIDTVIHYAASCNIDESVQNPDKYYENNVLSTLNLISTMIKYDVKKIINSSTCAIYGNARYLPVDENHAINPGNPYGASKRIAEKLIEYHGELKKIRYLIFRYFNVTGASEDGLFGDSKKPSSLLIQNAVRSALNIQPFYVTCSKVDTPDQTPIRDFINVVDLAEAHIKGINYLDNGGKSEIVNLGTGTGNSVLEVIKTVQTLTRAKYNIIYAQKPRLGEYVKMISSVSKAKKVLEWMPKRKINDSITSLLSWYKTHPNGWEY